MPQNRRKCHCEKLSLMVDVGGAIATNDNYNGVKEANTDEFAI